MSPAFVVKLTTSKGHVRYEVRFRLGGRGPQLYGGRFRTHGEAKERRAWINAEIAAMRVPNIKALVGQRPKTFSQVADEWVATRLDVAPATHANYSKHLLRMTVFAKCDPASITLADVQAWVAAQSDLKPSSLSRYLATLRQVLDFAGIEPNPARSKDLRRPRIERPEIRFPSAEEFATLVDLMPARWRLALRLLEATAMRVGEMAGLRWADVDAAGARFRVAGGKTRAARRWVQVPAVLMAAVEALTPREDRTPERPVFGGMTGQDLRQAMARVCRLAGMPVYSPHDLRHRRITLWHYEGVPMVELAARAGHSRTSLTVDVYGHVLLPEES